MLLRLCVLSLLNLYCVRQPSEQRGAGHISGIQQLDDNLTDLIIYSDLFIYKPNLSSPQFLFPPFFYIYIFER